MGIKRELKKVDIITSFLLSNRERMIKTLVAGKKPRNLHHFKLIFQALKGNSSSSESRTFIRYYLFEKRLFVFQIFFRLCKRIITWISSVCVFNDFKRSFFVVDASYKIQINFEVETKKNSFLITSRTFPGSCWLPDKTKYASFLIITSRISSCVELIWVSTRYINIEEFSMMQIKEGTIAKCFLSSPTAERCFQNKTLNSYMLFNK